MVVVEFPITQGEFAKVKKWGLGQKCEGNLDPIFGLFSQSFFSRGRLNYGQTDRQTDRQADRQTVWVRACYAIVLRQKLNLLELNLTESECV